MENTETNTISQYVTDWRVILAVGAIVAGSIWGASILAQGNADQPCQIVTNTSDLSCTVGSWDEWTDISQDDPEGYACETYEVQQKRVGRGTRISATTRTELYVAGACRPSMNGGSVTAYAGQGTCAVEDFRTVRRTVAGIGANNVDCNDVPVVVIGTSTGDFMDGTALIGGGLPIGGQLTPEQSAQLVTLRRKNIAAEITANPLLVGPNQTSVVTWKSRETTSCQVTATNNDSWSAVNGSATTSPITVPTTYTLTCIDFENNPVAPVSVTIAIAPKWSEQ